MRKRNTIDLSYNYHNIHLNIYRQLLQELTARRSALHSIYNASAMNAPAATTATNNTYIGVTYFTVTTTGEHAAAYATDQSQPPAEQTLNATTIKAFKIAATVVLTKAR